MMMAMKQWVQQLVHIVRFLHFANSSGVGRNLVNRQADTFQLS